MSGRTEISNVVTEAKAAGHSGAIVIRGTGRVSVRNQSGGIQLLGIHGAAETETTSGRTEISDVSGGVHSITHSGSISIDNARGSVVANNTSGSIDAFQLSGSVHAQTKSGAIRISQISPAPIRALADSGAIEVELASRSGYLIDAQSNSGRVTGGQGQSRQPRGKPPIERTNRCRRPACGPGYSFFENRDQLSLPCEIWVVVPSLMTWSCPVSA